MTENVPNRHNWVSSIKGRNLDIDTLTNMYARETYMITQRIFEYKGLPDTIPQKDLEFLLQVNGSATITKADDGKLYAFRGALGGLPNAYYLPTISIVANPYLKFNKTLNIDTDCVVMLNDSMYMGLSELINENAYLLAQCDISFKFAAINSRVPVVFTAPSDEALDSIEEFYNQIENGGKLSGLMDEDMFNSIKSFNFGTTSVITQLIEMKQYIYGTFYNKLGVQAPYNMKREHVNTNETTLNEDVLYPRIDDMLEQRRIAIDKINKMYGTSISVDLSSVWKQLRKQAQLELELKESEIDSEGGEPLNET